MNNSQSGATERDEATLVAALVRGDGDAGRLLIRRHGPALYHYGLCLMGEAADAEDLTQDVFLTLWERAGSFDPTRATLSTWLHRIAHNRAVDLLRRRRRSSGKPVDEAEPAAPDGASRREGRALLEGLLNAGLAALPLGQHSALALFYYREMTAGEIARVQGLSTAAVESLLARARRALRNELEHRQWDRDSLLGVLEEIRA